MSEITERIIIGAGDQERIAIISVAIPAGGELPIDPTFRFEGWLVKAKRRRYREGGTDRVRLTCERPPTITVDEDD